MEDAEDDRPDLFAADGEVITDFRNPLSGEVLETEPNNGKEDEDENAFDGLFGSQGETDGPSIPGLGL